MRQGTSLMAAFEKIDFRRLHQMFFHSRSLFLASRIVKQEASGDACGHFCVVFSHVILTLHMGLADSDTAFMQLALEEARDAGAAGEVPIGAVVVHDGKILARSGNRTIRDGDPTAHAEVVVIREAARVMGNYRLAGTTLYVTLEPCSMCAGAIVQARIPRVVYGADDPKGGAVRSCFEVLTSAALNHQVEIASGVLATECASLLQSFFAARR